MEKHCVPFFVTSVENKSCQPYAWDVHLICMSSVRHYRPNCICMSQHDVFSHVWMWNDLTNNTFVPVITLMPLLHHCLYVKYVMFVYDRIFNKKVCKICHFDITVGVAFLTGRNILLKNWNVLELVFIWIFVHYNKSYHSFKMFSVAASRWCFPIATSAVAQWLDHGWLQNFMYE